LETVKVTRKGSVAILTLNRPEKLNALNTHTLQLLKKELFLLNHDKKLKAIILNGAGRAFSTGADLKEIYNFSFKDAYEYSKLGQEVAWLLEMSNKYTIAAMHGYALGGALDIALACDLRVSTKDTKIGYPQTKHGLIPAFGGTQRLQQTVGPHNAQRIIQQGTILNAEDASRIGIVDSLSRKDLLKEAITIVGKIKNEQDIKKISHSKRSERKTHHLPRNMIHERSTFAHRFEIQKTRLLLRKFIEERKIQKMHAHHKKTASISTKTENRKKKR
jgi:enoyl-CoA hydratase